MINEQKHTQKGEKAADCTLMSYSPLVPEQQLINVLVLVLIATFLNDIGR